MTMAVESELLEEVQLRSSDGALMFVVRNGSRATYIERIQPLGPLGKLSHITRFTDIESFRKACRADSLSFTYPHLFIQLQKVVEARIGR